MIELFQTANTDPSLVVLEGFHAIKHANRFGAELLMVIHNRDHDLTDLITEVAPDMRNVVERSLPVEAAAFSGLFRHPHPTGIAAVARRSPPVAVEAMSEKAPIVLLDGPRHLGNIGAAVRISAAGGAAGLITVGDVDPWHPAAVRGSAGLHFALPVIGAGQLPDMTRPLIAFDPEGEDGGGYIPPNNAILAFGSERSGLSDATRAAADRLIAFPMNEGVSSINLAASVAIGLYMWRLDQ